MKAKTKELFLKIFKLAIMLVGAVITVNSIALFFVSNINLGIFLSLILGVAILLAAVLPKRLVLRIPKWIRVILISGICAAVLFSCALIGYGSIDTSSYKEDAIIVLGAGIHGKTPSLTLKKRLNRAVEYHKKNPEAIIIVSGGQGPQEDIPEAEAMEKYLIDKGVSRDVIIKESAADSTYNNFKLSKVILDDDIGDKYEVCFITNEYHIMRSELCAKTAGFKEITHIHSSTNISYLAAGVLRECLAVIKYAVFKS